MKNRLIGLLSIVLLLLAVAAIVLLVFTDKEQQGSIRIEYEVTGTAIVDNRAVVTVKSGVFSGEGVDPFSYVRLLDQFGSPYYPLNGFLKPSLGKGDSLEIQFQFFYPRTEQVVLEIRNSEGETVNYDVVFPELVETSVSEIFAK